MGAGSRGAVAGAWCVAQRLSGTGAPVLELCLQVVELMGVLVGRAGQGGSVGGCLGKGCGGHEGCIVVVVILLVCKQRFRLWRSGTTRFICVQAGASGSPAKTCACSLGIAQDVVVVVVTLV